MGTWGLFGFTLGLSGAGSGLFAEGLRCEDHPSLTYWGVIWMSVGSKYISSCSDGPSRDPSRFVFRGTFQ